MPSCPLPADDHVTPDDPTLEKRAVLCAHSAEHVVAPRAMVDAAFDGLSTVDGYYVRMESVQWPYPFIMLTPARGKHHEGYNLLKRDPDRIGPAHSDQLTVGISSYPSEVHWWLRKSRSGRGLSLCVRKQLDADQFAFATRMWGPEEWTAARIIGLFAGL